LIPVVATAISVLKNDGEIVPVDGFRRLSTWGKVAVVNIDSTNRQETHMMTAHVRAPSHASAPTHPSLLCVASISLIAGAAD